jgi:hypothetical protein
MFTVAWEQPEGAEEDETEEDSAQNQPSDYGGSEVNISQLHGYFNVGIVPTTGPKPCGTGRIVTFPNWIQVPIKAMQSVHY